MSSSDTDGPARGSDRAQTTGQVQSHTVAAATQQSMPRDARKSNDDKANTSHGIPTTGDEIWETREPKDDVWAWVPPAKDVWGWVNDKSKNVPALTLKQLNHLEGKVAIKEWEHNCAWSACKPLCFSTAPSKATQPPDESVKKAAQTSDHGELHNPPSSTRPNVPTETWDPEDKMYKALPELGSTGNDIGQAPEQQTWRVPIVETEKDKHVDPEPVLSINDKQREGDPPWPVSDGGVTYHDDLPAVNERPAPRLTTLDAEERSDEGARGDEPEQTRGGPSAGWFDMFPIRSSGRVRSTTLEKVIQNSKSLSKPTSLAQGEPLAGGVPAVAPWLEGVDAAKCGDAEQNDHRLPVLRQTSDQKRLELRKATANFAELMGKPARCAEELGVARLSFQDRFDLVEVGGKRSKAPSPSAAERPVLVDAGLDEMPVYTSQVGEAANRQVQHTLDLSLIHI